MAIRYTVPIKSYDNVDWRANIYSDSYVGAITTLKGSEGQSMMLEYSGKTDDHFGVIFDSRLTLNVICENNIDINDLQNSPDRNYRIEIQRNNALYWVGYMIAEGIQSPMRSEAFVLSLEAICGLTMLEYMDYVHSNNLPGVIGMNNNRCPMNFIRMILFDSQNLNVPIPIRWTNKLTNKVYEGQDVFVGAVQWSPRGEGFNEVDVNTGIALPKKSNYILEGMLKSMQCRIYQSKGKWIIRRINDYYTGSFPYKQIAGNLGVMNYTSSTEVIAKRIGAGGYPFILENAVLTNIPGVKSYKITYDADVKSNILPNGNLDLESTGFLIDWGFYNNNGAFYTTNDFSLDGRGGKSATLDNRTFTDGITNYFTMLSVGDTLTTNGMPIDAKDLVKLINFSFLFSPSQYGFPTEGNIDGVAKAVSLTAGGSGFPNGTHTNLIMVNGSAPGENGVVDITVSGNSVTSVVLRSGGAGYEVGGTFTVTDFYPFGTGFVGTITEVDDIPGVVDFDSDPLQLQIVLNTNDNQYFLDDFGIWRDSINTFISPKVEGLVIGEVARIALDKFQGIIVPEPANKPQSGDTCDIKVIFLVKAGQVYTVDNINISIEDSNDVYVNTVNQSKETKQEFDTLEISSSFGGYMVSNFMSNWDKSDLECDFKDGDLYEGTLTGLTADARIRCKHSASKIFNGTINVRNENWTFDEIYTIETMADRRFMPLNATYNVERCEVNLVAIETRNDDISRTEQSLGSNDKQLTN